MHKHIEIGVFMRIRTINVYELQFYSVSLAVCTRFISTPRIDNVIREQGVIDSLYLNIFFRWF
jgi:hypothetical protein